MHRFWYRPRSLLPRFYGGIGSKKGIDKQQWIALFILCSGSMMVAWPKPEKQAELDRDLTEEATHSMYVEWPLGPLFITIQVCLSGIAGIYTEWVYKHYGMTRSIHIDNLSMYFWGILSNGLQFFYFNNRDVDLVIDGDNGGNYSADFPWYLLNGFNYWTWLLIMVYIIHGLCIAQIMKYFSNIVKLFMNGGSILITGCLTWAIFGLNWTWPYVGGLVLVILAVLLYKSPKKFIT